LGAVGNVVQATAGLQPFYRKIAVPGTINNLSAVESSADRWLAGLSTGVVPQPNTYYAVFRAKASQIQGTILDSNVGSRNQWSLLSLVYQMFSGAFATTTSTAVVNKWESGSFACAGAASFSRQNGLQSANVNPGAAGIDGIMLLAAASGVNILNGFLAELIGYTTTLPYPPSVEAYFAAKYGVTPQ
jgi:hypothetical protein